MAQPQAVGPPHGNTHGRRLHTLTIAPFIGVVLRVIFFRTAEYDRMSPWIWSVASLGQSGIVSPQGGTIVRLIAGPVGLFVLMWWYNTRRRAPNLD